MIFLQIHSQKNIRLTIGLQMNKIKLNYVLHHEIDLILS